MTSQFIMAHSIPPVQIFITAVCETIISIRFLDILASIYEGWNFKSGNYLFTTDTK